MFLGRELTRSEPTPQHNGYLAVILSFLVIFGGIIFVSFSSSPGDTDYAEEGYYGTAAEGSGVSLVEQEGMALALEQKVAQKTIEAKMVDPHNPQAAKEAEIERVVGRFILADIGRLSGPERAHAFAEFEQLDHHALPQIVDGLNYSVEMGASCPISVMSKKLYHLIDTCEDREMLQSLTYQIGANVESGEWHGELAELRRACEQKLAEGN